MVVVDAEHVVAVIAGESVFHRVIVFAGIVTQEGVTTQEIVAFIAQYEL